MFLFCQDSETILGRNQYWYYKCPGRERVNEALYVTFTSIGAQVSCASWFPLPENIKFTGKLQI